MSEKMQANPAPVLWSRDFVLIIIISFFTFMGFQMLMPTLPILAKQLGGSDATAGLVVGIFAVSALVARPISGYALDRFGRKKLLFVGLFVFTVSVIAYHAAATLLLLLLNRVIHGFGWGLSSTASGTVATDIIPKSRMAEGMGFFGLAGTVAMAVAPATGLWLLSRWGFDSLFTLATAMVIVAVALAFLIRFPAVPLAQNPSFNLVEKSALAPATVVFFLTMTYGAIVAFLALYAAQKGITNIGFFFTVYALALFVTRPMTGKLADRVGFDIVVIPGILCVMAAMAVLAGAQTTAGFLLAAVLYGLGFGAAQPALQALAVIAASPQRRGGANGTFFTGFDLGIGISSVMWGAVSQVAGYSTMYLWTLAPALTALAVYLLTRPKGKGGKLA